MDKTRFELRSLPIPHFFYTENRVTLIGERVYCFIHAYTNPFFFGNEHLAEMFGCTDQAISDSIKKLESLGYVKCEYKTRAGGGKTRLVIDLYSNYNETTSRTPENRAPTTTKRLDKDIKVNNIKGNFGESSGYKGKEEWDAIKEARVGRKAGKTKFGSPYPTREPYEKKPRKRGTHAEHII